jgi:hypothetical protein
MFRSLYRIARPKTRKKMPPPPAGTARADNWKVPLGSHPDDCWYLLRSGKLDAGFLEGRAVSGWFF